MKTSAIQALVLMLASVIATALGMELALRVYHGKVFDVETLTPSPAKRAGRVMYDPGMGWIPRVGRVEGAWTSNVDASGLRNTGRSVPTGGRPILAIGDSFTFGDEVADEETWVSRLESRLNKRVLNAGVSAYGIDQAVLRAERLLEQYQPELVIVSYVTDDINRTEFDYLSYGGGWKPYFELVNGSLTLRNVPVPETPRPPRFAALRRVLGYSHLANFVWSRVAPRWWRNIPIIDRVHTDGENVSFALLTRLDSVARSQGIAFVAVALPSNGLASGQERFASLTRRARAQVGHVLDLTNETAHLPADSLRRLFQGGGHYTPSVNAVVAERIAAYLEGNGLVAPPGRRISVP
jgi:hypothetical protein